MRILSDRAEEFFRFVRERLRIWHKRYVIGIDPPWTEDPILQNYFFCNAIRALDKGTVYIYEKVLHKPEAEQLYLICIYRHFNRHGLFETLAEAANVIPPPVGGAFIENRTFPVVIDKHDADKLGQWFDTITRELGVKLYHMAYLTPPTAPKGVSKARGFALKLPAIAAKAIYIAGLDDLYPEKLFELIRTIPTYGGEFLAYEVYSDLSYLPSWPAADVNKVVNIGPGAMPAIAYLVGREEIDRETAYDIFWQLYEQQKTEWELLDIPKYSTVPIASWPKLSARDLEHSLCEFRKYINIRAFKEGRLGRVRLRIFRPPND